MEAGTLHASITVANTATAEAIIPNVWGYSGLAVAHVSSAEEISAR